MKQRTPSQVADTHSRIERWMGEMNYTVEHIVREELVWGLAGQREDSPGIAIAQKIGETDRIYVQIAYIVNDAFSERLSALDSGTRVQFLWDIRFQLLSMDSPFDGIADPLITVNFLDFVFIEALSRTTLAQTIFRVQRSYIALAWMFQRKFPDAQNELGDRDGLPSGFVM
jgi:hypothetical protein